MAYQLAKCIPIGRRSASLCRTLTRWLVGISAIGGIIYCQDPISCLVIYRPYEFCISRPSERDLGLFQSEGAPRRDSVLHVILLSSRHGLL